MASRSVSCSFTLVVGSTLATIMASPTFVSRMISLPSCSTTSTAASKQRSEESDASRDGEIFGPYAERDVAA